MTHREAGSRLATRIAFFVAGFGLACWAPLVPLAKARLEIDDGSLGLLLLCLGAGSVLTMQLTGAFISKLGARPIIVIGGMGQAILLPCLALAPTVPVMAIALLLFGGFLGLIDVSMNVHAVEVEKRSVRPLMSGFHGLFSVGGFVGALLLTAALSIHVSPLTGTIAAAALMIGAILFAAPRLIDTPQTEETPLLVVPRGIVALLALLAAITFLIEGAVLDWGALLLTGEGLLPTAQAGIGYSVFAVAMTIGRLTGDAVIARIGDRHTMFWGGLLAIAGNVILLTAPSVSLALLGFLLIGLGASNTVPVLFRQAGAQTVMPTGLAIAAVTTVGYAGVLVGPAGVGFAAQAIGLPGAFWVLTIMLALVPICATVATRRDHAGTASASPTS